MKWCGWVVSMCMGVGVGCGVCVGVCVWGCGCKGMGGGVMWLCAVMDVTRGEEEK